jgi:hypothetical protein
VDRPDLLSRRLELRPPVLDLVFADPRVERGLRLGLPIGLDRGGAVGQRAVEVGSERGVDRVLKRPRREREQGVDFGLLAAEPLHPPVLALLGVIEPRRGQAVVDRLPQSQADLPDPVLEVWEQQRLERAQLAADRGRHLATRRIEVGDGERDQDAPVLIGSLGDVMRLGVG